MPNLHKIAKNMQISQILSGKQKTDKINFKREYFSYAITPWKYAN
jgi:hypothetical protein